MQDKNVTEVFDMRLSDSARTLVMGNAEILNKCREISVDINNFKSAILNR